MRLNLVAHLVVITEMLFLEPVLRFLRSKGFLSKEKNEAIKNPYVHPTVADRIEALVDHLMHSEEKVDGFMSALRQTGQAELAEIVETGSDANSGQASPYKNNGPSERSWKLRLKQWVCPGLPGAAQCVAASGPTRGKWDRKFSWCRDPACHRYLCSACLESDDHHHSTTLKVQVKALHAAAYKRVKVDDAEKKKQLCKFADEIGQKVSETLQNFLLTKWDRQSSLRVIEDNLFVSPAEPPIQLLSSLTSDEAMAAVTIATGLMGGTMPEQTEVIPTSLSDILSCDPRSLLARLLTPADLHTAQDAPAETVAEPLVGEPATTLPDDESLAFGWEEKEDIPGLALMNRKAGIICTDDIYGPDARTEFLPPPLLKRLMSSELDEEGRYAPSVMNAVSEAGEELATLRDVAGWTALHIAAQRGATELTELLLKRAGVDVDAQAGNSWTPLMMAVLYEKAATAKVLIDGFADVTMRLRSGENAVHIACGERYSCGLELLLKVLPLDEVNAVDEDGKTALFAAARTGSARCAEQLLQAGADPSIKNKDGKTALHVATIRNHIEVVQILTKDLLHGPNNVDSQNNCGETALMLACQLGHVEAAKALMDAGADILLVNEQDGNGAVHWAAASGSVPIMEEFLARESRINFAFGGKFGACLTSACVQGHLGMAKLLLDNGADAYRADADGFSALSGAAQEGHNEILEFLLSQPFAAEDFGLRQQSNGQALILAIFQGHIQIAKSFLNSGSVALDYSVPDGKRKGNQAIHAAAQARRGAMVEYLLSRGVNPDVTNEEGMTPLIFAAQFGHVKCLQTLLDGGASPGIPSPAGTALHVAVHHDMSDAAALLLSVTPQHLLDTTASDGYTVLLYAARHGCTRIFARLCELGASLGARTKSGFSVLHFSSMAGHLAIVNYILQQEVGKALLDGKTYDEHGVTSLMVAAQSGHVEVCGALLSAGADPCASSAAGHTALHLAAGWDRLQVIKLLLQQKHVNVNQQRSDRRTPLMEASILGSLEGVMIFIKAGADVSLSDEDGLTALHLASAAKTSAQEKVKLLITAGASVSALDGQHWTWLHCAAVAGNAGVVGAVLAKPPVVNARNAKGQTPLHLAAHGGKLDTVRILLGFGCDSGLQAGDTSTALDVAARQGHTEVVRLLLKHQEVEAAGEQLSGHFMVQSWVKDL